MGLNRADLSREPASEGRRPRVDSPHGRRRRAAGGEVRWLDALAGRRWSCSGATQPVKLQEQPLQILEALLRQPGELVTREALTAHLWPDSVVDFEAGLNTAVRKLRAALADDAEAPKYVETVPRQGYRFIGAIERPRCRPGDRGAAPARRQRAAPRSERAGPGAAGLRPAWRRAGLATSVWWRLLRSPSRSLRLAPARPAVGVAPTRRPGHRSIGSRCCRSRT